MSQTDTEQLEKKYTVLMTFPVYAVHKTTVWASSKDEAESLASEERNIEWNLVECNPNKITVDGFPEYEVQEETE